MGFRTPQVRQPQIIRYTSLAAIGVGVLPGRSIMVGSGIVSDFFATFEAGNGPVGGTFTFQVLIGGNALEVITVLANAIGIFVAATASFPYSQSETLEFEIVSNAGAATGPVVLGFVAR